MNIAAIAQAGHRARPGLNHATLRRTLLSAGIVSALALGMSSGAYGELPAIEPDLRRLLRFMAALKGVFAILAFGVCFWRLARPSSAWREVIYVVGPGLMAGGSVFLWHGHSAGLAAVVLHVGLFALLVSALTDDAFFPNRPPRTA